VPDLLLPFVGLILLITITPGPDMLLVLRNGLQGGSSLAWATGAGCCAGIAVHAVAATVGLSAVIAASSEVYTVIKLAGAGYLVLLGATSLLRTFARHDDEDDIEADDPPAANPAPSPAPGTTTTLDRPRAFRQGLTSNLLNPKIAILFLTLLPQFVADGEPRAATTAVLAATFVVVGLVFMRALSLAVGAVTRLLQRRRVGVAVERITGTALVAIGVTVASDQR